MVAVGCAAQGGVMRRGVWCAGGCGAQWRHTLQNLGGLQFSQD